jgi:hypothetical protein
MEANEQSKRRMKQRYLHEQIIENNMDPDAFSQYLADRRENGELTRNQH